MTIPDHPEIGSSTGAMLERTRRRALRLRRRRRAALGALAAAVVALAVAVPLLATNASKATNVVRVVGRPPTGTSPSTTPITTAPAVGGPSARPSGTVAASPATATARSTPATSPPTTTGKPVAACTTSQLGASLANPQGTAGSVGYDLTLVNVGTVTCSISGYPGVSYVTGSGTTVGAPAQRNPSTPVVTADLAPGQAAAATLMEVDSLNYPPTTCQLTNVNGLRIYPPNQTAPLFVAQATKACGNPGAPVLQVGPTRPPTPAA